MVKFLIYPYEKAGKHRAKYQKKGDFSHRLKSPPNKSHFKSCKFGSTCRAHDYFIKSSSICFSWLFGSAPIALRGSPSIGTK